MNRINLQERIEELRAECNADDADTIVAYDWNEDGAKIIANCDGIPCENEYDYNPENGDQSLPRIYRLQPDGSYVYFETCYGGSPRDTILRQFAAAYLRNDDYGEEEAALLQCGMSKENIEKFIAHLPSEEEYDEMDEFEYDIALGDAVAYGLQLLK